MTNPVYQTAVEELEAVLSPRVVSRSLKEGLRQHGRSPESVDVETLEQILKSQVYRQLQVTMPVTDAKSTVAGIVERLREASDVVPSARSGLDDQAGRLERLMQALKPYNLYFEWPEVQKLRAQLQLLETEHAAAREAGALLADAEAQLVVVEQKLEDQLVLQAREVGELMESLEVVRSLGGPKVRRLESLVNHMVSAQESRQLATAELERARRLARDLRKLMESSVYAQAVSHGAEAGHDAPATEAPTEAERALAPEAPSDGVYDVESEDEEILAIDVGSLTPEASERLRLIDLASEGHDLTALREEHASLLDYRPDLAERVAALEAEVAEGRSVSEELAALRSDLPTAAEEVKADLRAELEELGTSLESLPDGVDASELRQAVKVSLGILSTTLPAAADVEHVRQLRALVDEQAEAQQRAEEALSAQLGAQDALVRRLEETLVRYEGQSPSEDVERLRSELESLRVAHANRTLVPEVVASVRQAEERLARDLAERATELSERRRARLESLRAQLLALPLTATLGERLHAALREVDRLLEDQAGSEAASALLFDDGAAPDPSGLGQGDESADVEALEPLIAALRGEAVLSVRRRLDELAARAAEVGSIRFAERVQQATTDLESGVFPDLAGLEVELGRAREAARAQQVGELHRLGREAQAFAGFDDPAVRELEELLAGEKRELSEGGYARRLGEAALLLDRIEAHLEERVSSVPGRLDAALGRFDAVAMLNSDDVATVRRVLQHLDSQRESLGRVSVGLKLQLESSLTSAEQLLANLEEEFEATRLIADELVAGGLLDGVLGVLGGPPEEEAVTTLGPTPGEVVERYAETPGVRAVGVLSPEGDLLAGEAPEAPAGAHAGSELARLRDAARALLPEGRGSDEEALVVTVGLSGSHLVAAFTPELTVALTVDSAALAPVVSGRLRRDLAGD